MEVWDFLESPAADAATNMAVDEVLLRTAAQRGRPLLRVVRGTPDDLELAALATVMASLSAPSDDQEAARRPAWGDPTTRLRTPVAHGPGAWRASGLPR